MAAKGKSDYQPQCAALTADGAQCRNSSRGTSRYCASHKGYQPPATKGLAKRIEGKSWSATDKLSDRQSTKNADTRPKVKGAKDTVLARRHAKKAAAAKAAARPTRRAAAKPATAARRPKPRSTASDWLPGKGSDPSEAGFVATLLSPERDYLVVYEEPDPDGIPTDDGLLLDIDAGQPVSLGEVDLEQKLDLELSNDTNWVGRLGFILAILGGLVGFGVCAWFSYVYPQDWYDEATGDVSGSGIIPGTALAAVLAFLMMLAGVILTHYGRRIQARGNLSRMRIVEKAFQPRVALNDEYAR